MGKPLAKEFTERIFQPGHPGGPGRPKGSRAKLSELAATLLYENFQVNGAETIERVRQRKPEVYLASVIALLPKQAQKVDSPFVDISDAELEALEQHLAAVRAKMVKTIEASATIVDVVDGGEDATDMGGELRAERNVDAEDAAA